MRPPHAERALRAAASAAWAFALMPAAYAMGRFAQRLIPGAPGRASFAYVAAIMAVVAAAASVGAWLWFSRRPDAAGKHLRIVLIIGAGLLVLQGVLLP